MKKLLSISLLIFSLLFFPKFVFAATDDINSFDTKIIVHQDGTMAVNEVINYDSGPGPRHGIFRDIPLVSKVGELYRVIKITVKNVTRDGQEEHYSLSNSGNELHINIGDPNTTISGPHLYEIGYTVENGIGSNFADHDEIFWNATGDSWKGEITKASAVVTTDFNAVSNGSKCFTGPVGSVETSCLTLQTFPERIVTNRVLNQGEGFSIVYSYPAGTFPKSTLQKTAPNAILDNPYLIIYFVLIILVWLIINIVLPIILWRWYQGKKNKKRFGPPVVNFDFPQGGDGKRLSPAQAGIMDTSLLDQNDVIGTIYDLAIRGYIRIENNKKDIKVLGLDVGDKDDFIITKLKDYSDVNPFEKRLLERLFEDGESIHLTTLQKDFYKTFTDLETDAFTALVDLGFYTKNPKTQRALFLIGGIIAVFTSNLILGLVLIYLSFRMNGRTEAGDEADYKIDGLKLFLSGRSREYTWNAQNLQVVEGMIPYAMSLGFIKEFMEKFQTAYPNYQPSWYSGYTPFYLGFNSLGNSFNSNFTTSAPSSSSGMGGGGFSGGGGGGGGGGGW